jgi:hypothetical protein
MIAPRPNDGEGAARAVLRLAVTSARENGDVEIEGVVVEGMAAPALIDKSRHADLLVVATAATAPSPDCSSDG